MNYSHTTLACLWLNFNRQAAPISLIETTIKKYSAKELMQLLIDNKVI